MKNAKRSIWTAIFLAATLTTTTACGGIKDSAPQEVPKVIAAESAAPSVSPSPSASATKKAPAPPAIKGIVTDGTSSFVQTTFDETDEDWDVDMTAANSGAKAMSEAEVQEAWEAVATFLAEQGIDSELRAGSAADNPAVFNKWVEDNASKFVARAKFVPGEASKGNTLDNQWGIQQDDAELGLTYNNGGSKPRILERTIHQGQVELNADGSLTFSPSFEYKMAVKDASGKDRKAVNTAQFVTTAVKEDGAWKISKNKGTFRPLQLVNADGSTSQVR